MTLVNFFFFAHQPERLRPYALRPNTPRTPANIHYDLFDEELNATVFHKVAEKCYYPATRLMLELVEAFQNDQKPFKLAFGLSGTFLDQAQRFTPDLLDIFKRLADTGMVEFTAETYYHSLASLWDDQRAEFKRQVQMHVEAIQRIFGQRPTVFRNTECLYNNDIARTVQEMGFAGIMTEGIDWVLDKWRSPDFLYQSTTGLPVLLRNYRYSDDIGYRFPNRAWEHYPLSAETFAGWMAGNTDEIINLMMDYEALGEHIWAETGIFDFIRHLPEQILKFPQLSFTTPSAAVRTLTPRGTINVGPFATISWADMERDTSAWLRNEMQQFCFEELRQMEEQMLQTNDPEYLRAWRLMQTSDHVYYLSDKSLSDGDVHTYFSAYGNLFEGFVRLQTAITDLKHAALYSRAPAMPGEALPVAPSDAPTVPAVDTPRTPSRARTKAEAEAIDGASPPKPKRTRKPKEPTDEVVQP
jgi:alpha-amylase